MNRVHFNNGGQVKFLKKATSKINKPIADIAKMCRVDKRTFYDWRRGKYQITYFALKKIAQLSRFSIPSEVDILPAYWYVRKGARRGAIERNRLYGNPGTPEGRKKGGLKTLEIFRRNPDYARKLGFKLRKELRYPRKSSLVAEFIGIVLGDGNINTNQVKITLNSKTDKEYSTYVVDLIKKLFSVKPSLRHEKKNALDITIYSRNLVDFLIECGLKLGDKIKNQVNVPNWIFDKPVFLKNCLRGLMDTDGGIYYHNHVTKGIKYKHIGLCFTSHSLPLLNSVHSMLLQLGISAKSDKKRHVSLYGKDIISSYLSKVGSSNLKHINRFKAYKGSKN